MRNQLAKVKNIRKLTLAHESLMNQDAAVPERMGLVHGFTGAGKTTAVAWLINQVNGVYVRAAATWTPTSMLGKISEELGLAPLHRCQPMLDGIVERLGQFNRPLFIDEADYLLRKGQMLETLRDIHDFSGVPVTLIGMEHIERKLAAHHKQLSRRLAQFVKFQACDLEDARTLADTCCEVHITDDLLSKIHTEAKGSIGLMTVGLSRIESFAKTQRWEAIAANQWGERQLFVTANRGGGR